MKIASILIWFVCLLADGFVAVRTLKRYADTKSVVDLIVGIGCTVLSCWFILCIVASFMI